MRNSSGVSHAARQVYAPGKNNAAQQPTGEQLVQAGERLRDRRILTREQENFVSESPLCSRYLYFRRQHLLGESNQLLLAASAHYGYLTGRTPQQPPGAASEILLQVEAKISEWQECRKAVREEMEYHGVATVLALVPLTGPSGTSDRVSHRLPR